MSSSSEGQSPTADIKRTAFRGAWRASLAERQGVPGATPFQFVPQQDTSAESMEPVRPSGPTNGGSDPVTSSGQDMEAKTSNGAEDVTVTGTETVAETPIDVERGLPDDQSDEKRGLLEAEKHSDTVNYNMSIYKVAINVIIIIIMLYKLK